MAARIPGPPPRAPSPRRPAAAQLPGVSCKDGYAAGFDFLPRLAPFAGQRATTAHNHRPLAPRRQPQPPRDAGLSSEMTARRRLDARIGSPSSRASEAPPTRAGQRHVPSPPSPSRTPLAHEPGPAPSPPPRQAPSLAPPPHLGSAHHAGRLGAVLLSRRSQRARRTPSGGSLKRSAAEAAAPCGPSNGCVSSRAPQQRRRQGGVPCSIQASISASSAAVMQPGAPMAP